MKENNLQIDNKNFGINKIYLLGASATIAVLLLTALDITVGSITGGDLTALPKTAVDRFAQFNDNWLLGLYNLDFLNVISSIIMIPAFFALFIAHLKTNNFSVKLALIIFIIGTTVFIANNTALPMFELSGKYISTTDENQKLLYAAAGESLIARGAHGSPGVFLGFILIIISEIALSFIMLSGKIFGKINSILGIVGCSSLFMYVILVTFIPGVKNLAMIFATPGGLLSMAWMIMFTIKLFKLAK